MYKAPSPYVKFYFKKIYNLHDLFQILLLTNSNICYDSTFIKFSFFNKCSVLPVR